MQLFYSPGACSLVPHIALEEAEAEFEPVRVTLAAGEHRRPEYLQINPRARVPALGVDGETVTEGIAILHLLASRFGAPGSIPLGDPLAAARTLSLLSFFASSVHISFAALWRGERFTDDLAAQEALKAGAQGAIRWWFDEIEGMMTDGWLVGAAPTGADGYALTFRRWGGRIGVDMSTYPRWAAHARRMVDRPAVGRVLEREGLGADEFAPA